jgi:hypothetical protein
VKKKTAKKQRKRVQRFLELWTDPLGLGSWHTTVTFYREETRYRETTGASVNGVMRCDCSWQYEQCHVDVNLERVRAMDDATLEYAVVHELCHALVHEMRWFDKGAEHEERVVTHLAKAFRWVRNASVDGRLPRVQT